MVKKQFLFNKYKISLPPPPHTMWTREESFELSSCHHQIRESPKTFNCVTERGENLRMNVSSPVHGRRRKSTCPLHSPTLPPIRVSIVIICLDTSFFQMSDFWSSIINYILLCSIKKHSSIICDCIHWIIIRVKVFINVKVKVCQQWRMIRMTKIYIFLSRISIGQNWYIFVL